MSCAKIEVFDPCKKEEPKTQLRLSNRSNAFGAHLGVGVEAVDAKGTVLRKVGVFAPGYGFCREWMTKEEADALGMPTEQHRHLTSLYAVKVN